MLTLKSSRFVIVMDACQSGTMLDIYLDHCQLMSVSKHDRYCVRLTLFTGAIYI